MSTIYKLAQLPGTNDEFIAEVTDVDDQGIAVSRFSAVESLSGFFKMIEIGWDGLSLVQITLLPEEFKVDIEIKKPQPRGTIAKPPFEQD